MSWKSLTSGRFQKSGVITKPPKVCRSLWVTDFTFKPMVSWNMACDDRGQPGAQVEQRRGSHWGSRDMKLGRKWKLKGRH